MFSLVFLGVLCALQISFNLPTFSGMDFEYKPPPVISETELFTNLLEATEGTNVSVAHFMYHLKHGIYASAFLAEIFTLGIDTHLFSDEEIAYPNNEERHIAIAVGKLWATLKGVRAMNRITAQISNVTSHSYLQATDRTDLFKHAFRKLDDAVLSEPTLGKVYAAEKVKMDSLTLSPLQFVNINLTKFGKIEKVLKRSVWPDPKSHMLVAHERFSQHVETKMENATPEEHDHVLLAHLLVDMATESEMKEDAEKAYDEGVKDAVKKGFDILKDNNTKTQNYTRFDKVLFTSLNNVIKTYPKLNEKVMEMKNTLQPEA